VGEPLPRERLLGEPPLGLGRVVQASSEVGESLEPPARELLAGGAQGFARGCRTTSTGSGRGLQLGALVRLDGRRRDVEPLDLRLLVLGKSGECFDLREVGLGGEALHHLAGRGRRVDVRQRRQIPAQRVGPLVEAVAQIVLRTREPREKPHRPRHVLNRVRPGEVDAGAAGVERRHRGEDAVRVIGEVHGDIARVAVSGDLESGRLRGIGGAGIEDVAQHLARLGGAAEALQQAAVSALAGAGEAEDHVDAGGEGERLAAREKVDVLEVADRAQLDETNLVLVGGQVGQLQGPGGGRIGRRGENRDDLVLLLFGQRSVSEATEKVALPGRTLLRPLVDALLQEHRDSVAERTDRSINPPHVHRHARATGISTLLRNADAPHDWRGSYVSAKPTVLPARATPVQSPRFRLARGVSSCRRPRTRRPPTPQRMSVVTGGTPGRGPSRQSDFVPPSARGYRARRLADHRRATRQPAGRMRRSRGRETA